MKNRDKIIVALDTYDLKIAKKLVKELRPKVKFFKIGPELINTGKAQELIRFINKLGGQVFYDIKLNDIPNTIGKTVKVISKLEIWGFTIHASAGGEAIREAVRNKGRSKIIGVTVLTSISDTECKSIFGRRSKDKVIQFAGMLLEEGADGIVCSPLEAKNIRDYKRFKDLRIVTPGIRPVWSDNNEQERRATPAEAIQAVPDH